MALKKWVFPVVDEKLTENIVKECGVSELAASIMVSRGIASPREANQFLFSDGEISSPFDMCDMDVAVARIKSAIDSGEHIAVYGDYDCDGITSTAVLYSYLLSAGGAVSYYIPVRDSDGYGLNNSAISKLSSDGVSLIITVDNGISAIDEVEYAKTLGIDIVITDHHQPGDTLPNAVAIVNPHRSDDKSSFKELCGVGVVFKLLVALEGDFAFVVENYADLVAIGTVGDIVPLVGENRTLVQHGIPLLKVSDNVGLAALLAVSKVSEPTAQKIAFSLIPRINAASRMGEAELALKLLLCEYEEEASNIALRLDLLNKERQAMEVKIMTQVEQTLLEEPHLLNQRVIIVFGEEWQMGVVGVVGSRLVRKYGKPVMIMSKHGDGLTGSGRSVSDFNLFEVLSSCSSLLTRYGGHKKAAGFSLDGENLPAFRVAVEKYAQANHDIMPTATITLDQVLTRENMTVEAIESLSVMEPFGTKNNSPLFLIKAARIDAILPISNGKNIKLTLSTPQFTCYALYFGMKIEDFTYKIGSIVDLAVTADLNTYNNKTSVSLFVKDIRDSHFNAVQEKFFVAKGYFEKLMKEEYIPKNVLEISIPTRDEIAVVYKTLRESVRSDYETLYIHLLKKKINYCKLRVIIEVLCELKLVKLTTAGGSFELCSVDAKVDLSESKLLMRLTQITV